VPRASLAVLVASLACIGVGQSMLFAVLPPAARALGVSPVEIATIFAVSATIWVFMSPRWGRRSDTVGRRPVILTGLLGYAASMLLLATTLTLGTTGVLPALLVFPLLVGSRSVFALVGSGTGPAAQAYVADRTTPIDRAPAVAMLSAAMGIGETIGPGLGALLTDFGLAVPIYAAGALAVGSASLIWRALPEARPPSASQATQGPRLRGSDPRIRAFVVIATALQAVRATTVITLALYLQDTLVLSARAAARAAGFGFVVLAAAGLFSQLGLVQRLRPAPRTMIRAGAPLMLVAFLVLTVARGYAGTLVALAVLGLGLGLVRPGVSAGVSLAVSPEEQGSAFGTLTGLAVIGNVVGPLVGTAVFEWAPHAPFALNAAIMAPIVVVTVASRRVRAAVA
jgi:MFS family permease